MARTAQGAITIMDVKDGIHPLSVVLSNHSHAFAASAAGLIPESERLAFRCEVYAFVGATRAIVNNTSPYANSTYRVSKVDPSGWVSTVTITNDQAIVTITTVPTGTVNKSAVIPLTITIVNSVGSETVVSAIISLSKAIEGTAGQIVQLTPNRQTFRFNELGVTTDGTVTIAVVSAGNTGALTAQYSVNGGAWAALTVGTTLNKAASIDINGTAPDTITLTAANFGSASNFAIKVAGATGGSDSVSIIKVQDGSTGPGALLVVINSSDGGYVFKNNTGNNKILSVTVYDMTTGAVVTPTTWQWKKNGVNVAITATLTVSAADVTDGGSEEYSCVVTVA
jgi:hypothetical protein